MALRPRRACLAESRMTGSVDYPGFDELDRIIDLNSQPVALDGDYVLVWLQQTLRGYDNPVIDAASAAANALGLPVFVYHGLRCDYPYASDRLTRFILGASRDLERDLERRGIACWQLVQRSTDHGKGMVYRLGKRAALVVVDRHETYIGRVQAESFAGKASIRTIAVDGTRLIPQKALPAKLGTTPAFRKASNALRDEWRRRRKEIEPADKRQIDPGIEELIHLARLTDGELDELIKRLPIDHTLPFASEHPATRAEADARLAAIDGSFLKAYNANRNNAAADRGATLLSPYLHFGVCAPWHVMDRIEAADVTASVKWKLLDELLTWREWSHWRMYERPDLLEYHTLPGFGRETLDAHRSDVRPELIPPEDIIAGRTGDPLFDACARAWLQTGWLHNNLRMYWAKQLLRFTKSPEDAWATACYINDRISYDGRDPATYVSMRWAFGESKPGFRDIPVYGRIMPKSSAPILKRSGMENWVSGWLAHESLSLDCRGSGALKSRYL